MNPFLPKRASLLISLVLVATLAPATSALAANDPANDKAQCVSEKHVRPWDCIEDAPGMVVAPTAQETAGPDAAPVDRSTLHGNIKTAITAGADLTDSQKEATRKTRFLFEEFYKSGSATLHNDALRSGRDQVADETKQTHTVVNQQNDAVSQQANIATAILQQLSGILTLIFR
jgi:hypothetical protein